MKAQRLIRKTHLKRAGRANVGGTPRNEYVLSGGQKAAWQPEELLCANSESPEIESLPSFFHEDHDVLSWCALMAMESPTAGALLKAAGESGWSFSLADLSSGGFYLDIPRKICQLDHHSLSPAALGRSAYFRNALLLTFIRTLRDIWHEERCGAFERDYNPETVLMLERLRAADGDTLAVFCGWELRAAGYTDVWRHLIGSGEGDMAMIFTRFLERDPAALFNGAALAYAFRQWYADHTRVDACDHETLQYLDEVLEEAGSRNPFGADRASGAVAEAISAMPDGTVYLAGLGESVLNDPFFAGLGDEINQAHLLHLKYDLEVILVNNVPFRDSKLARRIFPEGDITRTTRV